MTIVSIAIITGLFAIIFSSINSILFFVGSTFLSGIICGYINAKSVSSSVKSNNLTHSSSTSNNFHKSSSTSNNIAHSSSIPNNFARSSSILNKFHKSASTSNNLTNINQLVAENPFQYISTSSLLHHMYKIYETKSTFELIVNKYLTEDITSLRNELVEYLNKVGFTKQQNKEGELICAFNSLLRFFEISHPMLSNVFSENDKLTKSCLFTCTSEISNILLSKEGNHLQWQRDLAEFSRKVFIDINSLTNIEISNKLVYQLHTKYTSLTRDNINAAYVHLIKSIGFRLNEEEFHKEALFQSIFSVKNLIHPFAINRSEVDKNKYNSLMESLTWYSSDEIKNNLPENENFLYEYQLRLYKELTHV